MKNSLNSLLELKNAILSIGEMALNWWAVVFLGPLFLFLSVFNIIFGSDYQFLAFFFLTFSTSLWLLGFTLRKSSGINLSHNKIIEREGIYFLHSVSALVCLFMAIRLYSLFPWLSSIYESLGGLFEFFVFLVENTVFLSLAAVLGFLAPILIISLAIGHFSALVTSFFTRISPSKVQELKNLIFTLSVLVILLLGLLKIGPLFGLFAQILGILSTYFQKDGRWLANFLIGIPALYYLNSLFRGSKVVDEFITKFGK